MNDPVSVTLARTAAAYWQTADGLSVGLAVAQWLLFLVCVGLFAARLTSLLLARRREPAILSAFWGADSLTKAIDALSVRPSAKWHCAMAYRGVAAANQRFHQSSAASLAAMIPLSEWIARHLRAAFHEAQASNAAGVRALKLSTPSVLLLGLLGTLWQAVLLLCAGVGARAGLEMTLAGALTPLLSALAMAIFLWFAYWLLDRFARDRVVRLEGFMVDLHHYLLVELTDDSRSKDFARSVKT